LCRIVPGFLTGYYSDTGIDIFIDPCIDGEAEIVLFVPGSGILIVPVLVLVSQGSIIPEIVRPSVDLQGMLCLRRPGL
jgi:hypothetical protein